MTRWLLLPLGLGLAALAAYALLSSPPARVSSPPPPLSSRPEPGAGRPPPPAHPEIREASREKLLDILREADQGDAAREGRQ